MVEAITIQALNYIADECYWLSTRDEEARHILLANVSYKAWNENRLASCLSAHRDGVELPPVVSVEYRVSENSFYSLSDGQHRCSAAAANGYVEILSYVRGVYEICAADFVINENTLWKRGDEGWMPVNLEPLEPTLITEFNRIGIKNYRRNSSARA
ncbi:hypothetical protein [Photobacterium lutimaris]|uniref:ParB/Sulfiredoxin domain-containing protein n=1 Tax=Photobacterium lutimaris TaxID=388278 RepID=A0A2T3ITP9_9GAMM|nr:hypothetical protein [Photobacterium lutimaris]PSU31737.1 hypothetical protein C9I99_21360 [Photobacterium lutimaris]TDR72621.1 hypothetical protein DFP78_11397 [Photobacterium lutimaris]